MSKRLEGRNETIVEPDLPIIDAHHHLFYKPTVRYSTDDYAEDALAGHRIIASVYVEGGTYYRQSGPEVLRPLGEVEFANGVGAMADGGAFDGLRMCAAIVGHADLRRGESVGWLLDRAMEAAPDRFRGIRQITMDHPSETPFRYFLSGRPPSNVLHHPEFRTGLAELAKRGLIFDAAVFHIQLPELAELAGAFSNTPFVLNNMGIAMALEMTSDEKAQIFEDWRSNLAEIAKHENVICKVGGLGMPFWGFDLHERDQETSSKELAEIWRPYIETALQLFGAERCMAGSNYPPDSRSCGFVPLWNALKIITANYSKAEKKALFSGTAAQIYRIPLDDV